MNFRLWGKGAQQPKPGASDDEDKEKDAKVKSAESDDDDEEDDEDDDAEEKKDPEASEAEAAHAAAVAASANVPVAARQAVAFLERERIHAIVDAAGPDRVAQALHVALNSDMTAAQASGFLAAAGPDGGKSAAAGTGRLGLAGSMAGRRTPRVGADAGGDAGKSGEAREIDDAASSILAFMPGAQRKR